METSNSRDRKSSPRNWRVPHWGWGILATIVLVGVGTGLRFGIPIYCEQQAIRRIESLRGEISIRRKGGPDWLREQVGDGRMCVFDKVIAVSFRDLQTTDEDLKTLNWLTELEGLTLDGTRVTDAGLEHLNGLTKLEHLNLGRTRISDAGLKHLAGLKNLWILSLKDTQVTDVGMMQLKSLTNLEYLSVENTQVTDEVIEELQKVLPRLSDESYYRPAKLFRRSSDYPRPRTTRRHPNGPVIIGDSASQEQ